MKAHPNNSLFTFFLTVAGALANFPGRVEETLPGLFRHAGTGILDRDSGICASLYRQFDRFFG